MLGKAVGLALMAFLFVCPAVYAETIPQADTLEQYIESSSPDLSDTGFIVDKETGDTTNGSFEETFGAKYPGENGAVKAMESSGDYTVCGETENAYNVVSAFSTKRIAVHGEVTDRYGANNAVSYQGETLLTFNSEEETKDAYANLVSDFGEDNVFVDMPMETNAKGWGTTYMNLDVKSSEVASRGGIVTVAVLDTGADKNHRIFKGKTIYGYDVVNGDYTPEDDNGHGTMTAGIISESTPKNVRIMPIKVMNSKGDGSVVDISQGIRYAVQNGADVLNFSVGGEVKSVAAKYMDRYLREADDAKCVMVSASGNYGANMDNATYYPCESSYSLCVGSIDRYGKRTPFSNYGSSMDFCAPGKSISCAAKGTSNGYIYVSGTSFSCPYISAATALLCMEKGKMTTAEAREKLKAISVDVGEAGWDKYFGYGYPKFRGKTVATKPATKTVQKKTTKLRIKPAKPTITKAKWKKRGKRYRVMVRWGKVPRATGYEVYIKSVKKTKKGLKYAKKVRRGGNMYVAPKKFRKSAKKGSVVKVKVRAYNKYGYGRWSKWKRVR